MNDQPKTARPSGGPYVPTWQKVARIVLFACLAVPVLAVLGLVGWSYIDDSRGSRELAAALEEAGKAGCAVTRDDPLYAGWLEPLTESDSTFYYSWVVSVMPSLRDRYSAKEWKSLPLLGRDVPLPETPLDPLPAKTVEDIRAALVNCSEVTDALEKAADLAPGRFPIQWEGPGTIMSHLTWMRLSARMLTLKMWIDADDGRSRDALEDALHGLAIVRPLRQEPCVISSLVAAAIDSIVITGGLSRVFAGTNPENADLLRLENALLDTANSITAVTALKGEVLICRETCNAALRNDEAVWNSTGQPPAGGRTAAERRVNIWLSRGRMKRSCAGTVRIVAALVREAAKPTPETLSTAHTAGAGAAFVRLSRAYNPEYDDDRNPSVVNIILVVEKDRARLRAAAAACAALRYRNDCGRWPTSLDALVPAYIFALPEDPFTARPLLYRDAGEGIKIYSVGPDGVDDDGKPALETRPADVDQKSWEKYDDVGFRIWRREPPAVAVTGEPEKEP